MPVIIDGTNGVNTPNTFAFKNRIIDGGFTINQRGYTSGTSLSSGSYGHDRWKGGASGGTYTFTQGSTGVNTTITITAGSIIQVIEGANLPEGGTYVLSWTGTAQGKIGAGSFGASGITGTITAGTNTNIEFNTGTCGNVQLEIGSTATSFDYRPYGTELQLCQRYFQVFQGGAGKFQNLSTFQLYAQFPTSMRTSGVTGSLIGTVKIDNYAGGDPTISSIGSIATSGASGVNYVLVNLTGGSGSPTNGSIGGIYASGSANNGIALSAEL